MDSTRSVLVSRLPAIVSGPYGEIPGYLRSEPETPSVPLNTPVWNCHGLVTCFLTSAIYLCNFMDSANWGFSTSGLPRKSELLFFAPPSENPFFRHVNLLLSQRRAARLSAVLGHASFATHRSICCPTELILYPVCPCRSDGVLC